MSNLVQILLNSLRTITTVETPTQSAGAFNSTFRKRSSNRTELAAARREGTRFMLRRPRSNQQETRAQYVAPGLLLQRLSPTPCTQSLRFTDTFVTRAGPSNPWSCFACRAFNRRTNASRTFLERQQMTEADDKSVGMVRVTVKLGPDQYDELFQYVREVGGWFDGERVLP
jgi:hypothetical protein